jgi:predicted ribosomally synthesized peptide with SipW-like signal peptide
MKNVVLSIVVIAALAAAGIGGTFAHFSDTEESYDNYLQTDEMDLTVSTVMKSDGVWKSLGEYDDEPYGSGVPALIKESGYMYPCRDYSYHFDLHNISESTVGMAYMHFKNLRTEDIDSKDGDPKPEAEQVAESGGQLGQVQLPGILPDYVDLIGAAACEVVGIEIEEMDTTPVATVDLSGYDDPSMGGNGDGIVTLNELICHNIPLVEIPPCNSYVVLVRFHFFDIDEDTLIADGWITPPANPAPGDGGYFNGDDPDIADKCWDHWPTNAFQKDKLLFDILFSLAQVP